MGLGLRRGIARTVCAVEHTGQIRELEQADRNARYIGNCWQGRQGCCYLNGFLQAFMLQLEKASTISLHYVQKCLRYCLEPHKASHPDPKSEPAHLNNARADAAIALSMACTIFSDLPPCLL
jgi:hypothetical protein